MSRLLRLPLEDVTSLTLLFALERGQENQVIAPIHTQEMEKSKEQDISQREQGLPLIHQVHHLLKVFKSSMHPQSPPQRFLQGTNKNGLDTWRWAKKLKTFKEEGKNISFLSYDGIYGQTNKVLAFVQQFDAAFDDKHFTQHSKLCHIAMHFHKSARQ